MESIQDFEDMLELLHLAGVNKLRSSYAVKPGGFSPRDEAHTSPTRAESARQRVRPTRHRHHDGPLTKANLAPPLQGGCVLRCPSPWAQSPRLHASVASQQVALLPACRAERGAGRDAVFTRRNLAATAPATIRQTR